MTHQCVMAGVLLGGLLLAGTAAAAPSTKGKPHLRGLEPDASFDRTFERDEKEESARLCAEKTLKLLPLRSVPTSALALHDITVHVEAGYYTVLLPLLEPQGEIRLIYWGADTIEEVTTFIRLMQGRKIKALKVEGYSEELRRDTARPLSEEDLHVCSADTIKNFLQPCKDCVIVEWVFDGQID
jgi:hypothetical protein